jgi:hypothetical protein
MTDDGSTKLVYQAYVENHRPGQIDTWKPHTLAEWHAWVKAQQDHDWLVKGLIKPDSAILLSGPPTVGCKSWFAFALAGIIGSGKSVGILEAGQPPSPVLIIEEEGPRKPTANRFEMLQNGTGIPFLKLDNVYVSHREHICFDGPHWAEKIRDTVQQLGVKFVIVDTLAKVMRGNENSSQDFQKVGHGFDIIRETHCALMFIHHIRKDFDGASDDIDQQIRGSSALAGYYDIHLGIRKPLESQRYLDLYLRSNEIEDAHYTLNWAFDTGGNKASLLCEQIKDGTYTPAQRDNYADRLENGKGYTIKTLSQLWKRSFDNASKIAEELLVDGKLTEKGGKFYATKGGGQEEAGEESE